MKTEFSKEELHNALHSNDSKAQELIADQGKWESFKKKIYDFLEKGKKIPALGSVIDDVITMVELADAYVNKEYSDIPIGTIISVVAALLYILSPIDLIPDIVPVVGYVDDAAVVLMVLHFGVDKDLDRFRKWKMEIVHGEIKLFQEAYAEELKELIGDHYLAAAIYGDNDKLKLLLCEDEGAGSEIECIIKEIAVPVEILRGLKIESQDDILDTLEKSIVLEGIRWLPEKEKSIYLEPDFEDKWDEYIILEG